MNLFICACVCDVCIFMCVVFVCMWYVWVWVQVYEMYRYVCVWCVCGLYVEGVCDVCDVCVSACVHVMYVHVSECEHRHTNGVRGHFRCQPRPFPLIFWCGVSHVICHCCPCLSPWFSGALLSASRPALGVPGSQSCATVLSSLCRFYVFKLKPLRSYNKHIIHWAISLTIKFDFQVLCSLKLNLSRKWQWKVIFRNHYFSDSFKKLI